ncbi:MAG TPA: hypothetical protein PJ991_06270 [Kiritimatiellia bacterium]|nr:hypothetical protein [Kiritimatiellia bacterium]
MKARFCPPLWSFLFLLAMPLAVHSELDYQGKILLNDIPYTGDGLFKFAISDAGNTINYWANDGTGAGEPTAVITNPVWNGLFSIILGSSPMTPIDPATFSTTSGRYLRVWFSSGSGFSELLPSQKIVGSPTAMNSLLLNGLSASSIQSNAVSQATNAITLAGDIIGAPHANSIAPGVIVDADVNVAAAIAGTKIVQATTLVRGTVQLASGSTGTAAIATGHPSLNGFSQVNSISAGAPNSGFGIVGGAGVTVVDAGTNIIISSSSIPNLDNTIWVAMNGTPVGPGTIEAPYDTPQAGYSAAVGAFPGVPSTLIIASGDYAAGGHSLEMTNSRVHVLGLHRPRIVVLRDLAAGDMTALGGYKQVEGIVIDGFTHITATGGNIRFHNCRLNSPVLVDADRVIFQDCRIENNFDGGPAIHLGLPGTFASRVGIYQTSIRNHDPAFGAIEIGYAGMPSPNVQNLDVIGCEIINTHGPANGPGAPGPAIRDHSPFHGIGFPVKHFSHNYIKGPGPIPGGPPAIEDPGVIVPYPPGTGPFLGFYNNTIWGHVGSAPGGVPHAQFFGNNMVYGIINHPGAGTVGWLQAGAGTGIDASGNVEHELVFPLPLSDAWDD